MAYNWKTPAFTPTAYVARSGNDDLNGGSENAPYRNFSKAFAQAKYLIQCDAGNWGAVSMPEQTIKIFGNNSVFDYKGAGFPKIGGNSYFYNCAFKNVQTNFTQAYSSNIYYYNCVFNNILKLHSDVRNYCTNCVFIRVSDVRATYLSAEIWINNAIYKSNVLDITKIKLSVIHSCIIVISATFSVTLSNQNCYYNCLWKFKNRGSETLTELETKWGLVGDAAINAEYNDAFSVTTSPFSGNLYADPLFIDIESDNFNYQENSPCLTFVSGAIVGAGQKSLQTKIKADASGLSNSIETISAVNCLIQDNSIGFQRNDSGTPLGTAIAYEKLQVLSRKIEFGSNYVANLSSESNPEAVDSFADIDTVAIYPGTSLIVGEVYYVANGTVVNNSNTITTGNKFICVTGQTSFTSSDSGYLYRIIEKPLVQSVDFRFADGTGTTKYSAGTTLTIGDVYQVADNDIVINGQTLQVGDTFTCSKAELQTFTGGNVIKLLDSSLRKWHRIEINADILCKRVGDSASGAIDLASDGEPLTNGHYEFYSTANKARTSFTIQARVFQRRFVLNNKMML